MKATILKSKRSANSLTFFCLATVLLSLTCCSKGKSVKQELPSITQEGKNTFGCMFGNEFWLPDGRGIFHPDLRVYYYPVEKTVILECRRENPINENNRDFMRIAYDDIVLNEGEYLLAKENSRVNVSIRDKEYFLHNEGKLIITHLDTVNKIISGTFYFDVKEESTGEIVEVTNGRFDAAYRN